MVEQAESPGLSPETAEDYRAMHQTAEALDYIMRPHDTEFWKMCDLDDDELKSKLEFQAEDQPPGGLQGPPEHRR